jgi:hypothetical protein
MKTRKIICECGRIYSCKIKQQRKKSAYHQRCLEGKRYAERQKEKGKAKVYNMIFGSEGL